MHRPAMVQLHLLQHPAHRRRFCAYHVHDARRSSCTCPTQSRQRNPAPGQRPDVAELFIVPASTTTVRCTPPGCSPGCSRWRRAGGPHDLSQVTGVQQVLELKSQAVYCGACGGPTSTSSAARGLAVAAIRSPARPPGCIAVQLSSVGNCCVHNRDADIDEPGDAAPVGI
jgi:hypothetical protein